MRKAANLLLIACLVVVFTACESRTDRTGSGGVVLSISDFDGLPIAAGVNAAVDAGAFLQIEEISIENIAASPTQTTSELMNVEIVSYEVTYSRADRGTRVPPRFTRGIFGVAPVDGELTYDNLPVMGPDQFTVPPLSNLLFSQGAVDQETGESRITLNFSIRFFGRTLSGNAVETAPALFTVEFTP